MHAVEHADCERRVPLEDGDGQLLPAADMASITVPLMTRLFSDDRAARAARRFASGVWGGIEQPADSRKRRPSV